MPRTRILFVCLGNICRSQMAEAMFLAMLKGRGEADNYEIDSAGTSDEEHGNPMYPPARRCLLAHGIDPGAHRARQITPADYDLFDHIILMEEANLRQLRRTIPDDPEGKITLLLDHVPNASHRNIADPWYTGDFETTYNDLLLGLNALLQSLQGNL
ncbi:MAG: low molecular weight phosphotyrosine protein phosphatase [Bacteroidales bacterium]|nr:low molecular weight phosphotyrosine protein phosphatase [Bacteroidales bacterium]